MQLSLNSVDDLKNKLVIPAEFQLVSYWLTENTAQENILEIRGELIDPKGVVLNIFENKHEIKKGVLKFRNRTNIQGLPITTEGRYVFKVSQKKFGKKDYQVVAELPFDVKIAFNIMKK